MSDNTPTILPPVEGDTKRAFLVRNGLAKEGARGRFGKEAIAALALFPDFAFTEVTPAAKPKADKATRLATLHAASNDVNTENGADKAAAALARREAKRQERIAKAEGKPKISQVRADAPSPLDMPRRKQTVAYVVDPSIGQGGTLLAITTCARADKGGCGKAVNRCTHDAPLAPHYLPESVRLKPMSLTKPVV